MSDGAQEMKREIKGTEKTYQPPKLIEYGNVANLTRGTATTHDDSVTGRRRSNVPKP